ncbi:MAG: DUF1295 domain-containing protein [Hyphomonadaceae bacterium]|nr:DUF1295 domain-containing protein [Hyphomonadaceae bacterium]MBC6411582.1 DUF1295 domain-containing protein [Hyphomonadaceae bacterium]
MNADIWTNFGFSVLALALCLIPLWRIALKIDDASIIDVFWGAGFGIVALVCLALLDQHTPYTTLLALLPIIWAVRLSTYLATRNLGKDEDPRYTHMRKGKLARNWPKYTAIYVFGLQGALIAVISAPIWWGLAAANNSGIGWLSIIGAVLWLAGFVFETVGDAQLSAFKKKHAGFDGPKDEKPVLNAGLWRYTRHPNYFGNACMWTGIWLIACQAPWGWVTLFSPIIMTVFLVFISGKGLLEKTLGKREAYVDYMERTSGFFPLPPRKK